MADNIYLDFSKKKYFLDVCFSSKFTNIIASVPTGVNQLINTFENSFDLFFNNLYIL